MEDPASRERAVLLSGNSLGSAASSDRYMHRTGETFSKVTYPFVRYPSVHKAVRSSTGIANRATSFLPITPVALEECLVANGE